MIGLWRRSVLELLHFDIVGGCQLKCVGCPNSTLPPKINRIKPSVFADCLRNIDVGHVHYFRLFNYGEALLHDDLPGIFDALEVAPRFKFRQLEMSSNAQFARWDQVEEILRRRLVTRFVVSCDGDGTPDSYERFRPPGKWEKLIEFMERMKELRDMHAPGMDLVTRTVFFAPADKERWRAVVEPRGFQPEFRQWLNLVDGAENHSGREWRAAEGVCSFVEGGRQLYVDSDGTVVPCCAHPRAGDFGNLCTQKWSEIVSGQTRREFVDLLGTQRASMDICGTCEFGPAAPKPKRTIGAKITRMFTRATPAPTPSPVS